MKRRKKCYKEESALKESEKWRIMEWMWDNFPNCPDIEYVNDVGAAEGTMSFISSEGDEYTLKITKGNWREIT